MHYAYREFKMRICCQFVMRHIKIYKIHLLFSTGELWGRTVLSRAIMQRFVKQTQCECSCTTCIEALDTFQRTFNFYTSVLLVTFVDSST